MAMISPAMAFETMYERRFQYVGWCCSSADAVLGVRGSAGDGFSAMVMAFSSSVTGRLLGQEVFQAVAEPEAGAARHFVRGHAGDELIRGVEIELRLEEHVDVVLERGHLERVEIDRDRSLVDGVAVEVLVLAEEVARLVDHLEQIRHHAVMRPNERVVH